MLYLLNILTNISNVMVACCNQLAKTTMFACPLRTFSLILLLCQVQAFSISSSFVSNVSTHSINKAWSSTSKNLSRKHNNKASRIGMVFDRMSEECIGSLVTAQNEAAKLEMQDVGPEVVLLGLIDRPEGARRTLKEFGFNLRQARNALSSIQAKSDDGGSMGGNLSNLFSLQSKAREVELPFSAALKKCFARASDEANELSSDTINSEHFLLALLGEPANEEVMNVVDAMNLDNFSPGTFRNRLIANLKEYGSGSQLALATGEDLANTPTLEELGIDLTDQAKQGKLDDVFGRDLEIEQALRTLSRRRKNNPCLVGEPGVGKTAIVEGIAQIISAANLLANPQELEQYYDDIDDQLMSKLERMAELCPSRLKGYRIISIELANLVAGTKYRGEFEERVQSILAEVTDEKAPPTILFMDEIHLLIGAGSAEGGMDAANILKPALARGKLQLIGATTISEYRQHIESDAALERRLQPLMVKEPSIPQTLEIVKTLIPAYQKHFDVEYSDESLELAVNLSERYIKDRFMPDKALDVIDEAGALVSNRKDKLVTDEDVLKVVAQLSGVPVSGLKSDASVKVLGLQDVLQDRVVGQPAAVKCVVRCLKRYHAGMRDEKRPVGCFLFAGPTGVGKTELCKQLAGEYYTSKSDLIRIDMSEFMESHTVSKLIGPPPGYIGYEAGGSLTNAVRKNPHSIILLDEFEKAHPDVWNVLLQIMEDGILTDGKGRTVFFRDTVVVLTSNVGSKKVLEVANGYTIDRNLPDATFKPIAVKDADTKITSSSTKPTLTQAELMQKVQNNPKAMSVIQDAMKDQELLKIIQTRYNTPADMASNPIVEKFLGQIWDALDMGGSLDDQEFMAGLFSQVDEQAKQVESEQIYSQTASSRPIAVQSEMYKEMASVVKEELQSVIRPEILNRLDEIIVFEPLQPEALVDIANLLLNDSVNRAKRENNIKFTISNALMQRIVNEGGMDSMFGARPMRRAVQRYFEDTVSEAIISNFIADGDDILVDVSDGGSISNVNIVSLQSGSSMTVEVDEYSGGIGGVASSASNGLSVNGDSITDQRVTDTMTNAK